MENTKFRIGDYYRKENEWADGWAIMAEPRRFAAKFNSAVPGAYRQVTVDDVKQMAHCGLIGRHGFFTREDLETVRGILRYEQLREQEAERKRELELVH
jgi:hypothetical protein